MADKEQAIQIAKIEEHSKSTDEKLDGVLTTLKEILTQTKKTNGRVTRLEYWRASIIVVSGFLWSLALIYISYIMH
jgi:hypothetical protein